jgi:hypothetical protein
VAWFKKTKMEAIVMEKSRLHATGVSWRAACAHVKNQVDQLKDVNFIMGAYRDERYRRDNVWMEAMTTETRRRAEMKGIEFDDEPWAVDVEMPTLLPVTPWRTGPFVEEAIESFLHPNMGLPAVEIEAISGGNSHEGHEEGIPVSARQPYQYNGYPSMGLTATGGDGDGDELDGLDDGDELDGLDDGDELDGLDDGDELDGLDDGDELDELDDGDELDEDRDYMDGEELSDVDIKDDISYCGDVIEVLGDGVMEVDL